MTSILFAIVALLGTATAVQPMPYPLNLAYGAVADILCVDIDQAYYDFHKCGPPAHIDICQVWSWSAANNTIYAPPYLEVYISIGVNNEFIVIGVIKLPDDPEDAQQLLHNDTLTHMLDPLVDGGNVILAAQYAYNEYMNTTYTWPPEALSELFYYTTEMYFGGVQCVYARDTAQRHLRAKFGPQPIHRDSTQ